MKKQALSFKNKVIAAVSRIPHGSVLTYAQVAARAGSPKAFRAVGTILSKNFNPNIPCHRVICSDGNIGNYNRGREKKFLLLKKEGALQKSIKLKRS